MGPSPKIDRNSANMIRQPCSRRAPLGLAFSSQVSSSRSSRLQPCTLLVAKPPDGLLKVVELQNNFCRAERMIPHDFLVLLFVRSFPARGDSATAFSCLSCSAPPARCNSPPKWQPTTATPPSASSQQPPSSYPSSSPPRANSQSGCSFYSSFP